MMEDNYQDDQATFNMSGFLRKNALLFPHKPALLYPVRLTYKDLETEVNRYSWGLEKAGIRSGTKTILLIPAGPEMLFITFALFRISAVPVLIDPGMGMRAMLKALRGADAQAFIGIPKAHLLTILGPSAFRSVLTRLTIGCSFMPGVKGIRRFLSKENRIYPLKNVNPYKTAAVFFTSGSTGPAKGVVYTAGMLNRQVCITRDQFQISHDETDLCTFPLLGLFAICHGNSSVIADMNMVHPAKLDPARVIKNIEDFSCTQMFCSPMILNRLSKYCLANGTRLPTLRNIISAGAPVYKNILGDFAQIAGDRSVIHTPYGATEALPLTDITSRELMQLNDLPVEENGICIGYPVKGLEVHIISISDDQYDILTDNILVPINHVGEIIVRGPWVSTGYFSNTEADRLSKIYDPDGNSTWHRMGDLGRSDEKGRLWFYGRKSQRVETGSRTLFTIPCEAVYNRHPAVLRSALVGLPGRDRLQKRPVICIQLKRDHPPKGKLRAELTKIGKSNRLTEEIDDVVFFRSFPVDPRHNAKIFREKLAIWASRKIK